MAGAAAYGALFLPGCGSSGDSDELTFWNGFTGGDAPTMLAIIDAFQKEHPETRVRMVSVRWEDYYQQVPVAIVRGDDWIVYHAWDPGRSVEPQPAP